MDIQRGMRDKLSKYMNMSEPIEVSMQIVGNSEFDFSCFGVDAQGKLSDDRYMVFYNQTSSPNGEISYTPINGGVAFTIRPEMLPETINKLVFTVSIDGSGTMGNIISHMVTIGNAGSPSVVMSLTGNDFSGEKAIISIEIYRKDEWRFSASASGFNGGIADLLHYFGGEAEEDSAPQSAVQPTQPADSGNTIKVSLEKKLSAAPELVSLAKPIAVQLEKKKLTNTSARVALVMDMTGSMWMPYKNGEVQAVVNKMLPLAVQFDDDGQLDYWYYANTCERRPPVTLANYKTAVPENWPKVMTALGGTNNEPAVIEDVMNYYLGTQSPVYVIFITDGGACNPNEIERLICQSANMPIFWQFVGLDGGNYGILEKLDKLGGRSVDNTGFFAIDDFMNIQDDELYDRLLSEFPVWLEAAKNNGIIR